MIVKTDELNNGRLGNPQLITEINKNIKFTIVLVIERLNIQWHERIFLVQVTFIEQFNVASPIS